MSDAMAEALRDECRAIGCDLTCRKCSTRDAADRIAALKAEVARLREDIRQAKEAVESMRAGDPRFTLDSLLWGLTEAAARAALKAEGETP